MVAPLTPARGRLPSDHVSGQKAACGFRGIGATEFKARCLELMDLVAATGNPVVISKRGKPIVRLVPVQERPRSIVGALKGHARIRGDIVSPVDVRWDASD